MPAKKLTKDERSAAAVKLGLQMARKIGAAAVTMKVIAAKQKVSAPLLFHIFGNTAALTAAIKKLAKKEGVTLPPSVDMPAKRKPATVAPVKKAVPKMPTPAGRKPLTAAQKEAKRIKDAARRAPLPTPKTPVEKFKALPKPFEAALSQLPVA